MYMADEVPVKKNSLKTGIEDLDVVLEGGYPSPSNVMILGPAGLEKMLFAYHFIAAKEQDETAYFITADTTPESIQQKAGSVGVPIPSTVKFIDCYSSTLGKDKPVSSKHMFVPGPGALNDLSLALNEVMRQSQGKKTRIVFYSLSTFMLYNPKDSILKFLQVVGGRLKKAGATSLFVVEEGVHDSSLLGTVEHTMDEIYTLQSKAGGTLELKLPGLSVSLPLKVGPEGIVIL